MNYDSIDAIWTKSKGRKQWLLWGAKQRSLCEATTQVCHRLQLLGWLTD